MAARKPKDQSATTLPEFGVKREAISAYFSPPLARSTFYDFVEKGKIVPMNGLKGYFLLNASLQRLGLNTVAELPDVARPSGENLVRIAFSTLDPLLFPPPPWLLLQDAILQQDMDHTLRIAEKHRANLDALGSPYEKIAYMSGVLDQQVMADHGIR